MLSSSALLPDGLVLRSPARLLQRTSILCSNLPVWLQRTRNCDGPREPQPLQRTRRHLPGGDAAREYRRVIRSDGHVLYTFCSLPDGWVSRAGTAWLRRAVESDFAGNFLEEPRIPWYDCERSHRRRTHAGLATEIVIRKCCPIGSPLVIEHEARR